MIVLNQEIPTVSFSRNVKFGYKQAKNGEKVYSKCEAYIVLNKYSMREQKFGTGQEIGRAKINLSFFINERLHKYSVQMDKSKKQKNLFLTMRISVTEMGQDEISFHQIAFQSMIKATEKSAFIKEAN
jgi:hypothetical protein